MKSMISRTAALSVLAVGLAGCSYGDYGYGGLSVGYGSPYYYSNNYYSPSSYYGWYDGYYYPGTGYYIYDSYGSRYQWNDRQRRYWESRRGDRYDGRDNWDGYRRDDDRGRDRDREGRGW